MSAVIVNIEFTEMKKNKKESLKFTLKGTDEKGIGKQLYDMAGSIVHMCIKGCAVGKFPAEFVDIKKSAKGVVANFLLKGDLSDEKSGQIYAYSDSLVELTLEESQMSIEDFHDEETEWEEIEGDEQQEGLKVNVDSNGVAELVTEDKPLDPMTGVGNVVDIKKPRAERVTKTEKAAKAAAETKQEEDPDALPY